MTGRARRLRRRTDQLGWRFRRQHPIPPYVVDFACVEARFFIEADGGQHGSPVIIVFGIKHYAEAVGGSLGSGTTTFCRIVLAFSSQSPPRSALT